MIEEWGSLDWYNLVAAFMSLTSQVAKHHPLVRDLTAATLDGAYFPLPADSTMYT